MSAPIEVPHVAHRFVEVDGVNVFYREAGPPDAPTLLLLHGFPTASHQFGRLIDALAGRYHLIAPDYPGFGQSDAPKSATDGGSFEYTFDRLADVIEGFADKIGLNRFVMYVFDFGAPVGFRLATRRPEWIAGLVVQNGNAYEAGLSPMMRELITLRPEDEGAEAGLRDLYTLPAIRDQYLHGAGDPEAIPPDGWTLDAHFLEPAGRQRIQLDLAFDYHTNSELYPEWQAWLRKERPPTLVTWGRNDPFFLEAGALAYKDDVPDAEVHLLGTGHLALEDQLPEIASLIASFLDRKWSPGPPVTGERMRIAVVGASGLQGGTVVREALSRGHEVTAIARDANRLHDLEGARAAEADVFDIDAMTHALAGHDAVVAALKARTDSEVDLVPDAARALLEALPRAGVRRLVFLGGGGSLLTDSGVRFIDSPEFPEDFKPDALPGVRALDILRDADGVLDWSYASPPPFYLVEGERTGHYRVRPGDLPVVDAEGESRISFPDYAAAIVDAIESGSFVGERFTAGY
jgi:putative NADH-flavin reductase/pimeloyl-ACP methyl ester carboxylesterase